MSQNGTTVNFNNLYRIELFEMFVKHFSNFGVTFVDKESVTRNVWNTIIQYNFSFSKNDYDYPTNINKMIAKFINEHGGETEQYENYCILKTGSAQFRVNY